MPSFRMMEEGPAGDQLEEDSIEHAGHDAVNSELSGDFLPLTMR